MHPNTQRRIIELSRRFRPREIAWLLDLDYDAVRRVLLRRQWQASKRRQRAAMLARIERTERSKQR